VIVRSFPVAREKRYDEEAVALGADIIINEKPGSSLT
jgi:hypothetical protein